MSDLNNILCQQNQSLLHELEFMIEALNKSQVPKDIRPFAQQMVGICQSTAERITKYNFVLLKIAKEVDILEEVVRATEETTIVVRLLRSKYVPLVLRASEIDRIGLIIISWMHNQHTQTKNVVSVLSSGDWSMLPSINISDIKFPPIYYSPLADQRSLLFFPLVFHEFGHELYRSHKPEMDDLIAELQYEILELITPDSQRNDMYEMDRNIQRQVIANIWYRWIIELYCDAVGYRIGGPAFIYAFSSYLISWRRSDFYKELVELNDLRRDSHPITWLRIQFLIKRARATGQEGVSNHTESIWKTLATIWNVPTDYHGFYHEQLENTVERTINDMLTETEPRSYQPTEIENLKQTVKADSIIQLLNWAWQVYLTDPSSFFSWQAKQTKLILDNAESNLIFPFSQTP